MEVSIPTDKIIIAEKKASRLKWLTLPTITEILFIVLLATLTFVGSKRMLGDGDPGFHIKAGEYILNQGTMIKEDPFSFTVPGKAWVAWEWLADVIFAWVHGIMGLNGVVILCNIIFALTFCFLFKILISKQVNIFIALTLIVITLGASFLHWLSRPHMVSWLFTLIAYWMLEEYQLRRKKYIYLLPLLVLFWVNLHGGFMVALIMTAIYFLGNFITYLTTADEARSKECLKIALFFGAVWMVCLTASFINPYGIKLIPHIVDTYVSQSLIVDNTDEFKSPNFHDNTVKLYELCILLLIIALSFSRKKFNLTQIGLAVFWLHMSFFSSRNIPLFLIIMAPFIAEYLNDVLVQWQRRMDIKEWARSLIEIFFLLSKRFRNLEPGTNSPLYYVAPVIVMALLCLNGGSIGNKLILHAGFDSKRFPVEAVSFIESSHIPGKMFNEYIWGGYLIYRLYPEHRVFIDGRSDMYGEAFVEDYLHVIRANAKWADVLKKNDVNWAIVSNTSPIAAVLHADDGWTHIYKDDVAVIFIRDLPENRDFIKKYSNREGLKDGPVTS